MEESEEILLNSLKSFRISIASEISSIAQFNPTTLFSVCTQTLRRLPLIETPSFPTSLPDSMADRVRICTDVASAIRNLGYVGDISFHKFLYPSEEDLYKLVRFLVQRLCELSEASGVPETQNIHAGPEDLEDHQESTSDGGPEKIAHHRVLDNDEVLIGNSDTEADIVSGKIDHTLISGPSLGMLHINKESHENDCIREPAETLGDLRQNHAQSEDALGDSKDVLECVKGSTSCQEFSSKLNSKIGGVTHDHELQNVEEIETTKEAGRKASDDQDAVYFQQLTDQVKAQRLNLQQLEDQWDSSRGSLRTSKMLLLESLSVNNPDAQGKLQKLKDIELETDSVLSEIRRREEECARLSADLEKQPKAASRRSYVERITEITKNSRKQDVDIERILKETRELQLESNSIEERLHRTYAVADEMVFREAKKDTVSRQAYSLLTSIHESFDEIREKILETDRTRREAAEIETKLTTMASKSLDMEKLQADLDAVKRENNCLESKLHGPL